MPTAHALAALLAASLLAHNAYPPDCCDGSDCRPVPCADIVKVEQPHYPTLWKHEGTLFAENSIRAPIDERCHVCKSKISGRCIMFPLPKTS